MASHPLSKVFMQALSPAGQQAIQDIAYRHGFSADAVTHMLDTLLQGNASMAQFNHPEFGGCGQWMAGGMTMLSDMFNNALKFRVDSLCGELSRLIASQPGLIQQGSFQSQSQGAGLAQTQTSQAGWTNPGPVAGASLFVPPGPDWWGAELRWPNSTGSQNGVRYAYFAQARRLAIEIQGRVTIYDTLDHQIGGFSQQSSGGSLSFNSQYGLVDVASLPVVSVDGAAPALPPSAPPVWNAPIQQAAPSAAPGGGGGDIFALLERLADLRAKGVLTEDEYSSKKAELLARV